MRQFYQKDIHKTVGSGNRESFEVVKMLSRDPESTQPCFSETNLDFLIFFPKKAKN